MNMKIVVIAVLALVFIGAGSAAVVNYLSNMGEIETTVESPFSVELSADGVTYSPDKLVLDDRFGGEVSTFYVKYENRANEPLMVQVETLITCDTNGVVSGTQISHADFEDDAYPGNHDARVKHGVMIDGEMFLTADPTNLTGSVYGVPTNYEPMTHYRAGSDTLAMVGGLSGVWDLEFPALTTVIVTVTMNHAPNSIGFFEIVTEVQDDSTPWIN